MPQNEDELELKEGDLVSVMEKCDDGWFVGMCRGPRVRCTPRCSHACRIALIHTVFRQCDSRVLLVPLQEGGVTSSVSQPFPIGFLKDDKR